MAMRWPQALMACALLGILGCTLGGKAVAASWQICDVQLKVLAGRGPHGELQSRVLENRS